MPTGSWWDRLHFGLFFGIGFACANAIIAFIVTILSRAHT